MIISFICHSITYWWLSDGLNFNQLSSLLIISFIYHLITYWFLGDRPPIFPWCHVFLHSTILVLIVHVFFFLFMPHMWRMPLISCKGITLFLSTGIWPPHLRKGALKLLLWVLSRWQIFCFTFYKEIWKQLL